MTVLPLVVAVLAGPAPTAAPHTVVLMSLRANFTSEAWEPAERQVHIELRATGLEVVVVDGAAGSDEDLSRQLQEVTRREGAAAGILMRRAVRDGAIEIWVEDRVTGKSVMRRISAADLRQRDSAHTTAMRAVELLHASLIELALPHAPAGEVQPAPVVREIVARTLSEARSVGGPAPTLEVATGAATLISFGDVGALVGPALGVRVPVLGIWQIEGDVLVSIWGPTFDLATASARLDVVALRARLVRTFAPVEPLTLHAGVELGTLVLTARGHAPSTLIARDETSIVALAGVHAAAAYRLAPPVAIFAAGSVGAPLPRARILFEDTRVGRLSTIVASFQLGVALAL